MMKSKEDIIRKSEIILSISDRCSLEIGVTQSAMQHSYEERENQRLVMLKWLKANNFYEYMESTDKMLFEKKVGSIFFKNIFRENKFQHEALEPLLWSLGLISKMTPYSKYSLVDFHELMCTNIFDTMGEMLKKTILKNEEEVTFCCKIAMLWHWRVIEYKNQFYKKENIKDVIFRIFGNEYKNSIDYILKQQDDKQDFYIEDMPIYKLDKLSLQHLYRRTLWRYHAFQWIISNEDWYDISTDT